MRYASIVNKVYFEYKKNSNISESSSLIDFESIDKIGLLLEIEKNLKLSFEFEILLSAENLEKFKPFDHIENLISMIETNYNEN